MMMKTYKRRKAQQSQTQLPIKNPHQNYQQQDHKSEGTSKHKNPISVTHQNHQEEDHKCEGTRKDQNPIAVPYFPNDIVMEILSRVGIKILFNCRLVCKRWADLISTPELAQLHLSRSPTSCLIEPFNNQRGPRRLHLIDPEDTYNPQNKLVFIPKINLPNFPIWMTNSCNGLVCLGPPFSNESSKACNIYVCNPVLREYITIPKPSHVKEIRSLCCAFGFSHETNQYKVVLSSYNISSANLQADIYTLGEGSWRSIQNAPYLISTLNLCFNASVNGVFHWLPYSSSYPFICCFNFVTEQFCSVPEPSEFSPLEKKVCHEMRVGVINGKLSVCNYSEGDHIDIWVMKDYGVKESWSKDIVINLMISKRKFNTYETIMVMGSGEVLVIFNNALMKLYDPKSQVSERKLRIYGVRSEFHAIAHVPSLISLKDVAKGENLKVLGSD